MFVCSCRACCACCACCVFFFSSCMHWSSFYWYLIFNTCVCVCVARSKEWEQATMTARCYCPVKLRATGRWYHQHSIDWALFLVFSSSRWLHVHTDELTTQTTSATSASGLGSQQWECCNSSILRHENQRNICGNEQNTYRRRSSIDSSTLF